MSAKPSDEQPDSAPLSTPPCILHEQEFIRDFQAVKKTVERIETAITGDPELGHRGLVQRLSAVELRQDEQQKKHDGMDRKLAKWVGIVTGAWLALGFVKDWFAKK